MLWGMEPGAADPVDEDECVMLAGFGGWFLVEWGTYVARAPGTEALVAAHLETGTLVNSVVGIDDGFARVIARERGGWQPIERLDDGPEEPAWGVIAGALAFEWPQGCLLAVVPKPPPHRRLRPWLELKLEREGDELITVRGPAFGAEVPSPDEIAGELRVIERASGPERVYVTLEYERGGATWRARHEYLLPANDTVVMISAQARAGNERALFAAADTVARTLEWLRPE